MKSRDEVLSTFEKYGLSSGGCIHTFGESEEIQKFIWFVSNGKIVPFESPDAYVKVDNQVLIIEHFAIDGFEIFPDGGSKFQRSQSEATRKFDSIPATESGVHLSTKIGVANSYAGFLKNCQDKFNHHYERIPNYKEHLKKEGIANDDTIFTVCFLMDEVSPLGTLTHDGERMQPVCLAYSREFLDYFLTKPDVCWIISAIVRLYDSGYDPYFFSQFDIEACRKHILDYANFQFLSSEGTMRTDFKAIINIKPENE